MRKVWLSAAVSAPESTWPGNGREETLKRSHDTVQTVFGPTSVATTIPYTFGFYYRAVYRIADIYLLDDPLAAVDSHTGKKLFDECVCGFLMGSTRILVTHQLQYLEGADRIYVFNEVNSVISIYLIINHHHHNWFRQSLPVWLFPTALSHCFDLSYLYTYKAQLTENLIKLSQCQT